MDQMTSRPDRPLNEDDVRRIVHEEIAAALGMLGRAADHADGYDADTIQSYAYGCIAEAAKGAALRITCDHEYRFGQTKCWTCGEPEPELKNPFEGENDG